MDCKLSDNPADWAATRLAEVRDSIRAGNWEAAEAMANSLSACPLPVTGPELEAHLAALRQTVIVARASRSVAAARLARVQAAARFLRHDFGDVADFSHSREPLPLTRQQLSDGPDPASG